MEDFLSKNPFSKKSKIYLTIRNTRLYKTTSATVTIRLVALNTNKEKCLTST